MCTVIAQLRDTYNAVIRVMIAREWVKCTELTPTLTEWLCCVPIESTDICTHQWNPKQIEVQQFCDTGQTRNTRLMLSPVVRRRWIQGLLGYDVDLIIVY